MLPFLAHIGAEEVENPIKKSRNIRVLAEIYKELLEKSGWTAVFKRKLDLSHSIFTNSAPLGRVGHRVAMSVCVSVCLRHRVQLFSRPLIGPEIT